MRATSIILVCLAASGCSAEPLRQGVVASATPELASTTSITIDKSTLRPLSVPLNVGMKPTSAVSYVYLSQYPDNGGWQSVIKGKTRFERKPNNHLAQHVDITSAALENPAKRDAVPIPLSVSLIYEFDQDGEIWAIYRPVVSMPPDKPPRLTDRQWLAFTNEIHRMYDYGSGDLAYDCAGQVFGLSGKAIRSGYPIGAQNFDDFIDRISACTLATIRGGDTLGGPEYRAQLLSASPSELAMMMGDMRETYRQQFTGALAFSSDVRVVGTTFERGQEFFLAEGSINISFKGIDIKSSISTLIDPYSGLPYKSQNRVTVRGETDDSEDAEGVLAMNGSMSAFLADLPQAVPAVVTISEPKPAVTAPSNTGSLSDMYARSVGAVYLVRAGEYIGTGFAISTTEAVTSAHVVEGQEVATLVSASGQQIPVTVMALDERRDIALLKSTGPVFGNSLRFSADLPATGAQVAVIGCPLDPGLCGTLTTGVVSFSARPIEGINHVQIDAIINQGNSGGPILNLNGEVIAIAEFKVAPDTSFVGLSFGLASPEVLAFLREQQVLISSAEFVSSLQ